MTFIAPLLPQLIFFARSPVLSSVAVAPRQRSQSLWGYFMPRLRVRGHAPAGAGVRNSSGRGECPARMLSKEGPAGVSCSSAPRGEGQALRPEGASKSKLSSVSAGESAAAVSLHVLMLPSPSVCPTECMRERSPYLYRRSLQVCICNLCFMSGQGDR